MIIDRFVKKVTLPVGS